MNRAKLEVSKIEDYENPAFDTWQGETKTLVGVDSESCRVILDKSVSFYKPDWLIDAPESSKKFLSIYSSRRGDVEPPRFPEGAVICAERLSDDKIKIKFRSAESSRYILFYKVNISSNSEDMEYRILGNWCDTKNGVIEGSSHKDAKVFEYVIPCAGADKISVEIVAVDEYGNKSDRLTVNLNNKN